MTYIPFYSTELTDTVLAEAQRMREKSKAEQERNGHVE
jgi:hypothetical protein